MRSSLAAISVSNVDLDTSVLVPSSVRVLCEGDSVVLMMSLLGDEWDRGVLCCFEIAGEGRDGILFSCSNDTKRGFSSSKIDTSQNGAGLSRPRDAITARGMMLLIFCRN